MSNILKVRDKETKRWVDIPAIRGKDGNPGEDGYSPIAKVEEVNEGAKISITDKNGTTEVVVKNGKDGQGGSGITEDDVRRIVYEQIGGALNGSY